MSTVKVCGYGIKVSADDPNMDAKALAENIIKVNSTYAEYLHPFFTDENFDGQGNAFDFLALSFKNVVENAPGSSWYEFVFLNEPAGSFAIATQESASEVHNGDVSEPPMTSNGWSDKWAMQLWAKDFFPGYKVGWIAEDIDPEFIGKWRRADDDGGNSGVLQTQ